MPCEIYGEHARADAKVPDSTRFQEPLPLLGRIA